MCPCLSPILPFVAQVAIYFTNVLSRYCLVDLALSLVVITDSRHRMTSGETQTLVDLGLADKAPAHRSVDLRINIGVDMETTEE
jgi:hypothetical protein